MNDVQRICPQCTATGSLNARYCAKCGYDFSGALPVPQNNLPVVFSQAALPVLVGAASVALRIGWKVLQSRWTQAAAEKAVDAAINKARQASLQNASEQTIVDSSQPSPVPRQTDVAYARPRRTITIRSAWSVGDTNGTWRQGYTEHRIDLDD